MTNVAVACRPLMLPTHLIRHSRDTWSDDIIPLVLPLCHIGLTLALMYSFKVQLNCISILTTTNTEMIQVIKIAPRERHWDVYYELTGNAEQTDYLATLGVMVPATKFPLILWPRQQRGYNFLLKRCEISACVLVVDSTLQLRRWQKASLSDGKWRNVFLSPDHSTVS